LNLGGPVCRGIGGPVYCGIRGPVCRGITGPVCADSPVWTGKRWYSKILDHSWQRNYLGLSGYAVVSGTSRRFTVAILICYE